MNDSLSEIIDTLQELRRLHQLNLELLDQLSTSCGWILEHNISVPNAETICSLLSRAKSLLNEIQSDEPKLLQYRVIRRKVTDHKSDEEVTEPVARHCAICVT